MLQRLALASIAIGLILPFAACSGGNQNSSSNSSTTAAGASPAAQSSPAAGAANVAGGSTTIAGSTALLPLVKQAAVEYQTQHPDAKISVSGGGSMTGITQAAQKGVDIGDSDVPAPNQPSLVDHQVAVVGFGVVVNPQANVTNLTTQQIHDVFTGKVKNWSQVGGANQTITIINRPRSSGTRAVFVQKIMGGTQPTESGLTQDSSGTVATMVAQTPGAASYLALGYVKPGQQVAVSINGVAPTAANIESGKYPYWSYEHMFTNGQPSAGVAAFINYVKTDNALLTQLHFIPVTLMKVSK
jgi:phosphate transport system substrate-binding protein